MVPLDDMKLSIRFRNLSNECKYKLAAIKYLFKDKNINDNNLVIVDDNQI